eukprot:scaffold105594_cov27-Tisochrysis_lutea.AAC.1
MDHPGAIVALPPLPAPPDAPEWTGRHLLVCEHGRFRLLRRPTAADSAQLHEQFAYKSRPLGATSRLRFPIGQLPFTFRGSTLASSMALSEDGQRLYLSDFGANRVISCSIPRNYVESQIDFLSWGWRYLCSIGGSDSEQEGHVSRTLSWANDLTREPPEGCTPLELSAASALCLALNKDAEANPYVLGPGALLCVPETAITRLFWRAFRLVCSLTMAFANRHAHMARASDLADDTSVNVRKSYQLALLRVAKEVVYIGTADNTVAAYVSWAPGGLSRLDFCFNLGAGRRGTKIGEFRQPLGLARHKTEIFVADSENHRIQRGDGIGKAGKRHVDARAVHAFGDGYS